MDGATSRHMTDNSKQRRVVKPAESARPAAERGAPAGSRRRLKLPLGSKTAKTKPAARREFHLPLPDNQIGRLLGKRVRFVPRYFTEAWQELRLVTWPNRRDTLRLSLAVGIFAVIFGGLIWLVDYGLDKLLRQILL